MLQNYANNMVFGIWDPGHLASNVVSGIRAPSKRSNKTFVTSRTNKTVSQNIRDITDIVKNKSNIRDVTDAQNYLFIRDVTDAHNKFSRHP